MWCDDCPSWGQKLDCGALWELLMNICCDSVCEWGCLVRRHHSFRLFCLICGGVKFRRWGSNGVRCLVQGRFIPDCLRFQKRGFLSLFLWFYVNPGRFAFLLHALVAD